MTTLTDLEQTAQLAKDLWKSTWGSFDNKKSVIRIFGRRCEREFRSRGFKTIVKFVEVGEDCQMELMSIDDVTSPPTIVAFNIHKSTPLDEPLEYVGSDLHRANLVPSRLRASRFPGMFFVPMDKTGKVELTFDERVELYFGGPAMFLMDDFTRTDMACALDNDRIPTHRLIDQKMPGQSKLAKFVATFQEIRDARLRN